MRSVWADDGRAGVGIALTETPLSDVWRPLVLLLLLLLLLLRLLLLLLLLLLRPLILLYYNNYYHYYDYCYYYWRFLKEVVVPPTKTIVPIHDYYVYHTRIYFQTAIERPR